MKTLHQFVIDEKIGDITKPVTLFLIEPSRATKDKGEMFYTVKLSEAIRAGILTKQQLVRRITDDGGLLSENDMTQYKVYWEEWFKKSAEYRRIGMTAEGERDEAAKTLFASLELELTELRKKIQDFEINKSELFDHTAENWARNKAMIWWTLHLAYIQRDGDKEKTPVFVDGDKTTANDRFNKYEELANSESAFWTTVLDKLLLYTTIWYVTGADKPETFVETEKNYLK